MAYSLKAEDLINFMYLFNDEWNLRYQSVILRILAFFIQILHTLLNRM